MSILLVTFENLTLEKRQHPCKQAHAILRTRLSDYQGSPEAMAMERTERSQFTSFSINNILQKSDYSSTTFQDFQESYARFPTVNSRAISYQNQRKTDPRVDHMKGVTHGKYTRDRRPFQTHVQTRPNLTQGLTYTQVIQSHAGLVDSIISQ